MWGKCVCITALLCLAVAAEDQPETAMALKLNFKYYQRIDVIVRVPPGAISRTLQARVFQAGSAQPKVTQTVNLP